MLTPAQDATFNADVAADVVLNALPHTADSAFAIAAAYALDTNPAFIVWKTQVAKDEITQNGFDWTRLDNLSIGKARVWDALFENANTTMNPSKPNVRAGIEEVWKGTSADLAVRAAVYVHCRRTANRLEKLLATGTGTDETPATMGYVGTLSYQQVAQAMQWNV